MTKQSERRRNERSNSVSEVNDLLSVDPTNTQKWLHLGEVHLSNYNYQEALNCFEIALSIESKPMKDQLDAIKNHLGVGSYRRARELLVSMKETGWRNFRKTEDLNQIRKNASKLLNNT